MPDGLPAALRRRAGRSPTRPNWEVSTVAGGKLAQGADGTGGLAPQAGVASDPKPPPFDLALEAFNADQTLKRAKRRVMRDEDFELAGAERRAADRGRLPRGHERDGDDTGASVIDVLVRTDDGVQLDFLLRAPRADFDRARLDEVLDTIRLTVMRGIFSGLAGFFVAGVLLSATVGARCPTAGRTTRSPPPVSSPRCWPAPRRGVDGRLAGAAVDGDRRRGAGRAGADRRRSRRPT